MPSQMLSLALGVYAIEFFARLIAVGQPAGWGRRLANSVAAGTSLYLLWMASHLVATGFVLWGGIVGVTSFITLFMD